MKGVFGGIIGNPTVGRKHNNGWVGTKSVKKAIGCQIVFSFSSIVLTKAIGLGATAPIMYWWRSLVGRVPGVMILFKIFKNLFLGSKNT